MGKIFCIIGKSGSGKDTIKNSLTNEEYNIIANGNSESSTDTLIKFKFKLIELLNNANISTAYKDI